MELLLQAMNPGMQASVTQPQPEKGLALACRSAHCMARKGSATRTREPSRGRSCLLCAQAVSACRQAWGERRLSELDAEDRLATACEKAPTSDPATAALRAAFQVPPGPAFALGRCQAPCHVSHDRLLCKADMLALASWTLMPLCSPVVPPAACGSEPLKQL